MEHLYIATPTYDSTVSVGYCQSLCMTLMACTKANIGLSMDYKGGPYIHDNRNWLVHRFLRSMADAMLFIDADVSWPESAVVDLYQSGHDVCGGAYPIKSEDEQYPVKLTQWGNVEGHREAEYIPGGFMLIRRHVFEALALTVDSYPDQSFNNEIVHEYFQNVVHHRDMKLGEDIEFCRRWRAIGGKVWCLPDIDFEHQGPRQWKGNLARSLPALYDVQEAAE